jgi:hypothetical protein
VLQSSPEWSRRRAGPVTRPSAIRIARDSAWGEEVKSFFVSYNPADSPWAEWIAWQMEKSNYTKVLQAWDFRPGSNFVIEMQGATSQAERTIAVVSRDYQRSVCTRPEWVAAFRAYPTGQHHRLILDRVGACDPNGLLGQIV